MFQWLYKVKLLQVFQFKKKIVKLFGSQRWGTRFFERFKGGRDQKRLRTTALKHNLHHRLINVLHYIQKLSREKELFKNPCRTDLINLPSLTSDYCASAQLER